MAAFGGDPDLHCECRCHVPNENCAGRRYERNVGFVDCGNPGVLEEDGKKWCGKHAPSKVKAMEQKASHRSKWRSEAWSFDSKLRAAEREVMHAAEEVYQSQSGAGWEAEQQRLAVVKLVQAYGELESIRHAAEVHHQKRPAGIRRV
jgi:hypothetical protein